MPAVEALGSTTVICSDKTGTMTENRMVLSRLALNAGVIRVGGGATAPRGDFRDGERIVDPRTRPDLIRLLTVAALVNDASVERRNGELHLHGDPTEAALVVAAVKAGLDPDRPRARLAPAPRDPVLLDEPPHGDVQRDRRMAATSRWSRERRASCWSARPTARSAPTRVELTDRDREEILETNRALAGEGLRVLAVAWRPDGGPETRSFAG